MFRWTYHFHHQQMHYRFFKRKPVVAAKSTFQHRKWIQCSRLLRHTKTMDYSSARGTVQNQLNQSWGQQSLPNYACVSVSTTIAVDNSSCVAVSNCASIKSNISGETANAKVSPLVSFLANTLSRRVLRWA